MLDQRSARGDNTTRRIEDLKKMWKQKEARTPYNDQRSLMNESQTNSIMVVQKEKNENDLRQRLRTSWRKVYRALVKIDEGRSGLVRMQEFVDTLHQNKCFVSKDELIKIQKKYGSQFYGNESADKQQNQINYEYMSKEMGLHHSYLDYI